MPSTRACVICIRLVLCGAAAFARPTPPAGRRSNRQGRRDSDALEEITVTAQRREENARDVPISLTVFNSAEIEQQNFQGVESYFADPER